MSNEADSVADFFGNEDVVVGWQPLSDFFQVVYKQTRVETCEAQHVTENRPCMNILLFPKEKVNCCCDEEKDYRDTKAAYVHQSVYLFTMKSSLKRKIIYYSADRNSHVYPVVLWQLFGSGCGIVWFFCYTYNENVLFLATTSKVNFVRT